ncbi:Rv3235 family protein [Pseudactinotalea sp. Z1748]|uniref:Rv3235 family protein n=1 Tax=Pseudactinotalea sp. Z1748 TaxID=3413027 RepID=UPI003C7DBE53
MTAVGTRRSRNPEPVTALPPRRARELRVRPDPVRAQWDRVRFTGPQRESAGDAPAGSDAGSGHTDLPDPASWAATLARATVEVLQGQRPPAQLIRWMDADLWAALNRRALLGVQVAGRPDRPAQVRPRRVHGCAVSATTWEFSVVLHDGDRMRAVALRLEVLRGRWCATALSIG